MKGKHYLAVLCILPFIFTLTGCTHIKDARNTTGSFTNEVRASTHKKKLYYKVNNGKRNVAKSSDHSVSIVLPRSSEQRTVLLSASPSFTNQLKVKVPVSKSIDDWRDFCNDYNDFQTLSKSTNSKKYMISQKYKNIKNGQGKIRYPGYYLQYNISNSKLIALRLSAFPLDNDYESLIGYFGMKEYKASLDSAVSALGNGTDNSIDDPGSLVKNKYSYTKVKTGKFSGCHYRVAQVPGHIYFDVWK